jgi:hypothetical protein
MKIIQPEFKFVMCISAFSEKDLQEKLLEFLKYQGANGKPITDYAVECVSVYVNWQILVYYNLPV